MTPSRRYFPLALAFFFVLFLAVPFQTDGAFQAKKDKAARGAPKKNIVAVNAVRKGAGKGQLDKKGGDGKELESTDLEVVFACPRMCSTFREKGFTCGSTFRGHHHRAECHPSVSESYPSGSGDNVLRCPLVRDCPQRTTRSLNFTATNLDKHMRVRHGGLGDVIDPTKTPGKLAVSAAVV